MAKKYGIDLPSRVIIVEIFLQADKQKRHIENCSGVPGIIYNFNNKNLVISEDNFKSKGDIPMAM